MKKLLLFLVLLAFRQSGKAQSFVVDSTRFVGGDSSCGTQCNYAFKTKDGGVFFAGKTTCYNGIGDIPPNYKGAGDVVVGKLDSNLNILWIKVYGGTALDYAAEAVQTPDGGFAVLSTTESNDSDVSGNHGYGDLWLIKLDSLGKLQWQKCFGSPDDEQAISIALTPDLGFILLGNSYGQGDDVPNHYSGSFWDADWFIVKTDGLGNKQWTKTIGGTGFEDGYGSILSVDNNYYLISHSDSRDYDCVDTFWHPNVNTGYDYWVFKMDSSGTILWDSSYGSTGSDGVSKAIWDVRDSSLVINGHPGANDYMVTGFTGTSDFWVIKINKNGTLIWEKCIGSNTNHPYETAGICIAPSGYVLNESSDPGRVGQEDEWIFQIDTLGNNFFNKQFGGLQYETPSSIFPFKNGYVATGSTNSVNFTEGINTGFLPRWNDVYFTFLEEKSLAIPNLQKDKKNLTLFPNPANNILFIYTPASNGILQIINCIGANIFYSIYENKKYFELNTSNWIKGVYLVKWEDEDGNIAYNKFIIN